MGSFARRHRAALQRADRQAQALAARAQALALPRGVELAEPLPGLRPQGAAGLALSLFDIVRWDETADPSAEAFFAEVAKGLDRDVLAQEGYQPLSDAYAFGTRDELCSCDDEDVNLPCTMHGDDDEFLE